MSIEQNPGDGFELRPVGDELIVFDLETNETHVLSPEGVEAFQAPGVDRRLLLKTGAIAGALLGAGAVQTILAPSAAAASSGPKSISGSGSCPAHSSDAPINFSGDGFVAGNVTVSITYPISSSATNTVSGTFTQTKAGPLTGTLTLTGVKSGARDATISATDASGTAATTGAVTITSC